jgi:hypothetical protein
MYWKVEMAPFAVEATYIRFEEGDLVIPFAK